MMRSAVSMRLKSVALALSLLALGSSCGGGGAGGSDEVVYLYIFNAYPGTKSLSLYGPSGAIVTNLAFGQRTPVPVPVDRNLGTNFTLTLDGAPQPFNTASDLFGLYPHETATFLIKKRSAVDAADAMTIRHVQSISPVCRMWFYNALSLSNRDVGSFDYLAAWRIEQPADAGYAANDPRNGLYSAMQSYPYFYTTDTEKGLPGAYRFVWAGVAAQGGSILSHRPTADYLECLGDDPDDKQKADCAEPQIYPGHVIGVDNGESRAFVVPPFLMDGENCRVPFQLHSDFDSIFVGEGHQSGERLETEATFAKGQDYHWVLYGRPVNPLVAAWASSDGATGGGFVTLPPYPGQAPANTTPVE